MVWGVGFHHAQAICHALDMRIDGDGRLTESDVKHHACGFSTDPRQCFERRAMIRDFSGVSFDQQPTQFNDVFCFASVKTDVFDKRRDAVHAQRVDRRWRIRHGVELAGGDVD